MQSSAVANNSFLEMVMTQGSVFLYMMIGAWLLYRLMNYYFPNNEKAQIRQVIEGFCMSGCMFFLWLKMNWDWFTVGMLGVFLFFISTYRLLRVLLGSKANL